MSNLTITVEDGVLKKARVRALEEGTSINAVLRDFMEAYAGLRNEQASALHDLLALSAQVQSRRGDRRWTREELHERA